MNEKLLQYIWKLQRYNRSALHCADGRALQILKAGEHNTNQGPDFLNAKIKVGETMWAGSIEIHVAASDWIRHSHGDDENYNNVILHVVWQNDQTFDDLFPTLELQPLVSKILLDTYTSMMHRSAFIACEKQIGIVDEFIIEGWKERLLMERLEEKISRLSEGLEKTTYNWEEVLWWSVARNFGLKVNADAFESVAQSIPIQILLKHQTQIHQLEALLFGQAGLLHNAHEEAYPKMLYKEYCFLKSKYQLKPPFIKIQFLRMRPANFPTVRLAQLAVFIKNNFPFFSYVSEEAEIVSIRNSIQTIPNDYWLYHYIFDEILPYKVKKLGVNTANLILTNALIPMMYAYGAHMCNEGWKIKALRWLEQLPPEKNTITGGFEQLGIKNKSAADSQSLIYLKRSYCDVLRCLECSVGAAILKGN